MPTVAESIAAWEADEDLAAMLIISDANAVTLPPLPATLRRLTCRDCSGLLSLPALLSSLKRLSCQGCPGLVSLPTLPAALTRLSCGYWPWLTCLPTLPAGLTQLYCCSCPGLTCMPALPAALTALDCIDCPGLASLSTLPAALTRLYLRSCLGLTCLPALPTTLTHLSCRNCPRLTCLPALPAGLTHLDCSSCPGLTSLPALPAGLPVCVAVRVGTSTKQNAFFSAPHGVYAYSGLPASCPPHFGYLPLVWCFYVADTHHDAQDGKGHKNAEQDEEVQLGTGVKGVKGQGGRPAAWHQLWHKVGNGPRRTPNVYVAAVVQVNNVVVAASEPQGGHGRVLLVYSQLVARFFHVQPKRFGNGGRGF